MNTSVLGFTLLELLISVSVITILATTALPGLSQLLEKQRLSAQTYSIWRMINKTRELAVITGERKSLCGLDQNRHCSLQNIRRLVIYNDANRNNRFDTGDTDLEYLELGENNIRIKVGNKVRTIVFNSSGSTRVAGGIIVCPKSQNDTLIRKITFSLPGKVYLDPDRDGDGRVETAEGEIVTCDDK